MGAAMELKTVKTEHVPVQVLEGGSGQPLVYLHGAGGMTAEDPFLAKLSQSFHVHAPFLPGYGESEEAPELRDMLDITLHTLDVVDALGLKDPILVGHSMGGMIAAEMAALAPHDISRLGLICPSGLWLEDHPIVDIFATLPFEMPALMFHDAVAGAAMMTAGRNVSDPNFLQTYLVQNARQLGMAGRILFPIPDRGLASRAVAGSRPRPSWSGAIPTAPCRRSTPRSSSAASRAPNWFPSPRPATWSSSKRPTRWRDAIKRLEPRSEARRDGGVEVLAPSGRDLLAQGELRRHALRSFAGRQRREK